MAFPPVLFGPAVVGSCAVRESEDASERSVSGFRIITEERREGEKKKREGEESKP